jgi:hypothetical protein
MQLVYPKGRTVAIAKDNPGEMVARSSGDQSDPIFMPPKAAPRSYAGVDSETWRHPINDILSFIATESSSPLGSLRSLLYQIYSSQAEHTSERLALRMHNYSMTAC